MTNSDPKLFFEYAYGCTPRVFTYIISCDGSDLLKFGKSVDPQWRLSTMQTGCPFKLQIEWFWPEDIENEMHAHFLDSRVSGEWFRVTIDEAITVAAKLAKAKWQNILLERKD